MPRIRNNIPLRLNLQRVRREFRGQQGTYRTTFLAAVNGAVRVPGGFFWVHDLASADSSGNATYGAPYQLPIEPGAAIDPKPDFAVRVIKINGQEYVHGMSPGELQRAGYDAHQTNVLDPSRKYVALAQISDMQAFPRGDDTVRVEPVLYEKQDGTYAIYSAGAMSPYIDLLTAYTPADEDDSTIVCVWLDTHDNVAASTQSSEFERSPTIIYTPSEALPFINEAAVLRPADAMGVRCFLVNGDSTVLDMTSAFHDLRPFFHSPPGMGVDNPVTRHTRVWAGREWQHRGLLKIEALLEIKGRLKIYGDATGGESGSGGITQLTGDVTAGPGSGSQAATLATVNADVGSFTNASVTVNGKGLVTAASSGAAPMIDFDVAADTGTPATITDGDTVTFAGGTGITSVISGDTVTHNLDNTAVTPGQYIHPVGLTVDQQGRITQLFEGAPLSPDYISENAFAMRWIDNQTVDFGVGYAEIGSEIVRKTEITRVDVAAASWGIGSEAASQVIWFYINAGGFIVPFAAGPNAPDSTTAETPKATMLVNQSGWNGTAASGLNATSVVYDNDTGEGNITPGDIVIVYASSDSDYSVSRGRGSAAAGSSNNVSAALITAINTGTNTLTLEAGHNIAINDNDRLLVVPRGALIYRWDSGLPYRFIGSMYNNASSNLEENRQSDFALINFLPGADVVTTSTSYTDIHSALNLTLMCDGSPTMVTWKSTLRSGSAAIGALTLMVDEVDEAGDHGIVFTNHSVNTPVGFERLLHRLLPGTHTIKLRWKVASGGLTIPAGTTQTTHPQFAAYLAH